MLTDFWKIIVKHLKPLIVGIFDIHIKWCWCFFHFATNKTDLTVNQNNTKLYDDDVSSTMFMTSCMFVVCAEILKGKCSHTEQLGESGDVGRPRKRLKTRHDLPTSYHRLYNIIQDTFNTIVTKSVATKDVYWRIETHLKQIICYIVIHETFNAIVSYGLLVVYLYVSRPAASILWYWDSRLYCFSWHVVTMYWQQWSDRMPWL